MVNPSPNLIASLSLLMNSQPVEWRQVTGGYTAALRWVVLLENGLSVFVKAAVDEQTAAWLEAECFNYSNLSATFLPTFYGFEVAGDFPFLVLEDLSKAHWPPPWNKQQIEAVFQALEQLKGIPIPTHMLQLEDLRSELGGWQDVLNDPTGFLALGVADDAWLKRAGQQLLHAEQSAILSGDALVHLDIRSDNICFRDEQVVIIDWNHARQGNSAFDLINWLPSLYLEGGPKPWEITIKEPELIALMAGYFASKAPLPPPRHGTNIRQFQLKQLQVTLPWACRALGIQIQP